MLVSAERTHRFASCKQALVLDGPRIARLQMMADRLPQFADEFILRLDATDDHLLDVAAQQAGVSIKRGAALPHGLGIRAHVIPQQRNFA